MNAAVIYKTKYGATHQYAQWIGSELSLPIFDTEEIEPDQLTDFDCLIIGSSVYYGKLLIKKWLLFNWRYIQGKDIFLFVVSGTPKDKREKLNSYIINSLSPEAINSCKIFFLPGKLLLSELSFIERFMLKLATKMASKINTPSRNSIEYNNVKKENITEIITAIRLQS